jgi:hypothetical protein
VVFIYLQCQGWIVVPNSRMADTMRYEFIAIHRETQERALVQVKTGNTALDTDTWSRFPEKVRVKPFKNVTRGKDVAPSRM